MDILTSAFKTIGFKSKKLYIAFILLVLSFTGLTLAVAIRFSNDAQVYNNMSSEDIHTEIISSSYYDSFNNMEFTRIYIPKMNLSTTDQNTLEKTLGKVYYDYSCQLWFYNGGNPGYCDQKLYNVIEIDEDFVTANGVELVGELPKEGEALVSYEYLMNNATSAIDNLDKCSINSGRYSSSSSSIKISGYLKNAPDEYGIYTIPENVIFSLKAQNFTNFKEENIQKKMAYVADKITPAQLVQLSKHLGGSTIYFSGYIMGMLAGYEYTHQKMKWVLPVAIAFVLIAFGALYVYGFDQVNTFRYDVIEWNRSGHTKALFGVMIIQSIVLCIIAYLISLALVQPLMSLINAGLMKKSIDFTLASGQKLLVYLPKVVFIHWLPTLITIEALQILICITTFITYRGAKDFK